MNKILSVLLCVFILVSLVNYSSKPEDQVQKSYEEQKALYDGIITQYTSLLTSKYNGEEPPSLNTEGMSERETAIAKTLYDIVDGHKDVESLGYAYKDFDGNGTPELIILTKYRAIRAIFTISEHLPILLESNYDVGSDFTFATNNRFFMRRDSANDNIGETTFYTCRVSGEEMVYDAIYGNSYYIGGIEALEFFQIKDGKRVLISEDDFNELYREYKKSTVPEYTTTTKLLAPRIYFPLSDKATDENLPIADFSSYAAIRETYAKISTCLDKFDSMSFSAGAYDNLFAFPNDLSYEYYIRLLYAAYNGASNFGYDEIDLNGDGQDELVLMNEDYRIKAIFTQKDSVPVLLDEFAHETCWLDDMGLIHVDNEEYYELEYNLYELTETNDYNLVYSILAAENGNRYLTKNGKTEKISFEESLDLYYNEYCRYTEPFEPNEQTRNVSNLTYTPLALPTETTINAAFEQAWHKYAKLEKTSNKDSARSNTYLSFESATVISLKYVFTYSYPDPDRDQYYLDDSTESTLKINVRNENGVLVFDDNGIKGKVEFGQNYLWLIIDESTDERFPVGNHCYEKYSIDDLIL